MPPLKIVLDTNALLRSIARRSAYAIILDKLYENAYELYLSNEIQLEYEEKIADIFSKETAELIIGAFSLIDNVKKIDVHFHLGLIKNDPDDNKFSDCAFQETLISWSQTINILTYLNRSLFRLLML